MSKSLGIWILVIVAAPCAAKAADDQAAFLLKADVYAFEAKQYGAAGKPVTKTLARRYEGLSEAYRARASKAHTHS